VLQGQATEFQLKPDFVGRMGEELLVDQPCERGIVMVQAGESCTRKEQILCGRVPAFQELDPHLASLLGFQDGVVMGRKVLNPLLRTLDPSVLRGAHLCW